MSNLVCPNCRTPLALTVVALVDTPAVARPIRAAPAAPSHVAAEPRGKNATLLGDARFHRRWVRRYSRIIKALRAR
jgi:hypothetical protein